MIETYDQFVEQVDGIGLMAMAGSFLKGFPALQALTREEQWHTDDAKTDPWIWKEQIARERKAAFGCLLGGHKGFVSRALFPYWYAACRPEREPEERFADGLLSRQVPAVMELFAPGAERSTAEIRALAGVTPKSGASAVDAAVIQLQREAYLVVCGNRRKKNKQGEEYGWPANTYCRAEDWDAQLVQAGEALEKGPARAFLLEHCTALHPEIDGKKLEKLLFGKLPA